MSPLDLIPEPYRFAGIAVVAAIVVGAAGIKVHGYGNTREAAGYNRGHAETEALRVAYIATAASATADYRQREETLQHRVNAAEDNYAALQPEHARLLVAQRSLLSEHGQLRDAIAAYAARSSSAAPDTAAAASERAAALGVLLAEALRADAESSTAAEANGDAVRTLLAAWPSNQP